MDTTKAKATLTLAGAKQIILKATEKAAELKVGGAIAVVDEGGHLICLERLEGTMPAAANLAIGKAVTAISFKRPTIKLENIIHEQRPVMLGLQGALSIPYTPLMGGHLIYKNGEIVGAVAIAGAETGQNDELIASYAAESFS